MDAGSSSDCARRLSREGRPAHCGKPPLFFNFFFLHSRQHVRLGRSFKSICYSFFFSLCLCTGLDVRLHGCIVSPTFLYSLFCFWSGNIYFNHVNSILYFFFF